MKKTRKKDMAAQQKFWRAATLSAIAAAAALGRIGQTHEVKRRFDIPPGDAVLSLNEWGDQADLNVIGSFERIRDVKTQEVRGEYTPQEALRRLVAGTGIACRYTKPGTMWCTLPQEKAQTTVVRRAPDPSNSEPRLEMPEAQVLVTGTHIRGGSPIGSRRLVITRKDIESSGFSTVQDLIRALPQNFNGGPTEDTRFIGRETRTNAGMGVAMNLRGLGPGETLVLLNGRRLAPGGSEGAFTDISSIPLGAVEQIELLPDSGSALYGTDAIGGVVNVVLRRDYEGFESHARLGTGSGDVPDEYQGSQLFGMHWNKFNTLLGVEYRQREALPASERAQSHSDLRRFGGDNFDVQQSTPGTIVAGGQTWAIPSGQDGTSVNSGDFVAGSRNLQDRYKGADFIPLQRHLGIMSTAEYRPSEETSIFVDALLSRRMPEQRSPGFAMDLPVTSDNPFYVNPAGGEEPITVSYNFGEDLGPITSKVTVDTVNVTAGMQMTAPGAWRILSHAGHAREQLSARNSGSVNLATLFAALTDRDRSTAFNPFGDGSYTNPQTLARINNHATFTSNSTITSLNASGDGPLLPLPSGDMKLAVGVEFRHESFQSALRDSNMPVTPDSRLGRDVSAVFSELLIPLADPENAPRGLRSLQISLAARYEKSTDVGGTTAPKLGLHWSPWRDVSLRNTWTRAFRAPNLADLSEIRNLSMITFAADASSPFGAPVLAWLGKNRDLRPEAAKSWTLGFEIGPRWLAGWEAALTYFDVQLQNQFGEMESNVFAANLLTDPQFQPLLTRDPTLQQRQEVCGRSIFLGAADACLADPVTAIIDLRLSNSARLMTSGLDLNASRELVLSSGGLKLDLSGTYVLRYVEQKTPQAQLRELVDTQNNPLRLRMRGSVSWDRMGLEGHPGFGITAFVNYDGDYRDTASQPNRQVSSWTTLDLQLRYDVAATTGTVLDDTRLYFNLRNALGENPPFLNNQLGFGFDAENADLLGRVISFEARKRW